MVINLKRIFKILLILNVLYSPFESISQNNIKNGSLKIVLKNFNDSLNIVLYNDTNIINLKKYYSDIDKLNGSIQITQSLNIGLYDIFIKDILSNKSIIYKDVIIKRNKITFLYCDLEKIEFDKFPKIVNFVQKKGIQVYLKDGY